MNAVVPNSIVTVLAPSMCMLFAEEPLILSVLLFFQSNRDSTIYAYALFDTAT